MKIKFGSEVDPKSVCAFMRKAFGDCGITICVTSSDRHDEECMVLKTVNLDDADENIVLEGADIDDDDQRGDDERQIAIPLAAFYGESDAPQLEIEYH